MRDPVGAQVGIEEPRHVMGEPPAHVHPVGHRGDRQIVRRHAGPEPRPHLPRDAAVQLAHPIGRAREADGQNGHRERLPLVGGILPSQGEELVPVEAKPAMVRAEVAVHQIRGKDVNPGGHGCVRGEDVAGGHQFPRHRKPHPLLLHYPPDALQREEGRMALVQVADGGLDPEGGQRADPADPEQDLLPDPHVLVPAVQVSGHGAIFRTIARQVGVQQVQWHPPHLGTPDLRLDLASGILHLDGDRSAVRPPLQIER